MGQNSCLTWCQSLSFQEVMSSNFNVFFIFPHLLSTHAKKAADEEECQHVQVSQLNIHCWFIT